MERQRVPKCFSLFSLPKKPPSTSTLTTDDVVVKGNKLMLKDICDMVSKTYSQEELAESSVEGGKGSNGELNLLRMHSLPLD